MKVKYILIIVFASYACTLAAQPQLATQQVLEGITFYQDLRKPSVYYYAPSKLRLGKESDGTPKLQVVLTRYTGTKCLGDQGEKQFLNIIQFGVQMERVNATKLRLAKKTLGTNASIRPLPIQNVEAQLVASIGGEYKRLGGTGSSEGNSSNKRTYWTERTFTLRLSNADAQLLEGMLEDKKLALMVNYAFHAEVITDIANRIDVSGTDSTAISNLEQQVEHLMEVDSTPVLQIIAADAFPIQVDLKEYPDKFKKIDINEAGIPADYPALEVRCFDFTNGIRPDLNMKEIQIKALGVTGTNWVELEPVTFSRFQPDINGQQVNFRNAVRIGQDFRFRVIEHPKEGDPTASPWQEMSFCSGLLDITTLVANVSFTKRDIDIEVPTEIFAENGIAEMQIAINYLFKGKRQQQVLSFTPNSVASLRPWNLVYDKGTNINYQTIWTLTEGRTEFSKSSLLSEDNYIFCNYTKKK